MTFVDLFEFCNRKVSKRRSINSRELTTQYFVDFFFIFYALFDIFRFVILHFVFVSQFSSTLPLYHLTVNVVRYVHWMALDEMYVLVLIRYP